MKKKVRFFFFMTFSLSLPFMCIAWDGTLFPASVVRSGVGCQGELASRIYTQVNSPDLYLYLDPGNTCLGDEFNYMDSYTAILLAACNDNATVRVTETGGCWPDSGSFPGVVTSGDCCEYYSSYPSCLGGSPTVTCEELIEVARSFNPEVSESSLRWPVKAYFGEKTYRGVNNPNYRAVFRLYGEDSCNDQLELKRFNDAVTVGNVNDEFYQYYSTRRGVQSLVDSVMDVYLYEYVGPGYDAFGYVYRGSGLSMFQYKDIINNYGDYHSELSGYFDYDPEYNGALKGGLFEFDVNIVGTQCVYQDYRYVMAPVKWTECQAWDVENWGDNYIGYDFGYVSIIANPSGYYDSYWIYPDHESFRAWEIWRYPVDENNQAIGPIELYNSVAMGFDPYGYISAPGGGDSTNDILLEDGYIYRFRADIDGFVWSEEFAGWDCPKTGSGALGTYRKSRISKQIITDHTVGGAYERRY